MGSLRRREFLKTLGIGAAAACLPLCPPRAIAERRPMADIVVLLPGITGSVLQKDGRDVWALSSEGITGALTTMGRNIDSLKLTDDSPEVDDIGDGVTATRLFPDAHLIPGLWKIDGYTGLRKWILDTFEVRVGENYFEFPYDWRRDNRVAARRLARASHLWLKNWRERSGNASAKLVLVAHSMGGLVSRHFIEVLDGWRDTRSLITFGTPFRGSLKAVDFLCNGLQKSVGPFKLFDLTELMRSFTSVYQLLPIYPSYDPGNGKLARIGETSAIPNIDPQRAVRALAFHRGIEKAVEDNSKRAPYVRDRYRIYPIVGTFQPTLQSARLVGGKVIASTQYPGPNTQFAYDGDGTVPRVSATPIEAREDVGPVFVAELHGSLQNTRASLIQLEGLLAPRPSMELFRDLELPRVALEIDDVFAASEPIPFRVRCEDPDLTLNAVIVNSTTGTEIRRRLIAPEANDVRKATFGNLPAGTYRLTVGAQGRSQRVTDFFVVVD
jgi:hypothetical protein